MSNDTQNNENPFAAKDSATVKSAPVNSGTIAMPSNKASIANVFGWFQQAISLLTTHRNAWFKVGATVVIALVAFLGLIVLGSLVHPAIGGIFAAIFVLVYFVFTLFSVHIFAGLFYAVHQLHETKTLNPKDIFVGFKGNNILRLFGFLLLDIVLLIVIYILMKVVMLIVGSIMSLNFFIAAIFSIVLAPIFLIAFLIFMPLFASLFLHAPLMAIAYNMTVIGSIKQVVGGLSKNTIPLILRSFVSMMIVMVLYILPSMLFLISLFLFGASSMGSIIASGMMGGGSLSLLALIMNMGGAFMFYLLLVILTIFPLVLICLFSGYLIELKSAYYAFRNIYLKDEAAPSTPSFKNLF